MSLWINRNMPRMLPQAQEVSLRHCKIYVMVSLQTSQYGALKSVWPRRVRRGLAPLRC